MDLAVLPRGGDQRVQDSSVGLQRPVRAFVTIKGALQIESRALQNARLRRPNCMMIKGSPRVQSTQRVELGSYQ